jgi:predicted dehydrogenase
MRRINFFIITLLLICFTSITNAQSTQRTKIAIVGLVHSHCWGFVTKLNQMHQSGDLIEIVGISDDNQELRDYIKTLVPGVPVYDNYGKMLDEKKPAVVWSFVENDRHLEVTKCGAQDSRDG